MNILSGWFNKRNNLYRVLSLILILVFLTLTLSAQQSEINILFPTLQDYKIHLNGLTSRTSGTSPARIMKLDNNSDILIACIDGKTEEQLNVMGIQYLQSQLRVLIDWGMLQFKEGIYKTVIPIFREQESKSLRDLLKAESENITSVLLPDLLSLKEELKGIGKENSIFVLLYSYIFHDLFWQHLKNDDFYQKPELSTENPFWSGALWAIYPPPEFSLGTLAMGGNGLRLHVNMISGQFSPEVKSIVEPFSQFQFLMDLIKDISEDKKVDDEDIKTKLEPYKIIDKQGRLTTLKIIENENNKLYKLCKSLSEKYHEKLVSLINSEMMKRLACVDNKHLAALVIFYELKWILIKNFVKDGLIDEPIAIKDPGRITHSDIGDLIFITESGKEKDTNEK